MASLVDDLVLLAYDDATGRNRVQHLEIGVAGAVLLELALAGRVVFPGRRRSEVRKVLKTFGEGSWAGDATRAAVQAAQAAVMAAVSASIAASAAVSSGG